MSDVIKIALYVGTGFAGCKHEDVYEMPREDWDSMSEKERDDLLNELAVEYRAERIECSAWVIDE